MAEFKETPNAEGGGDGTAPAKGESSAAGGLLAAAAQAAAAAKPQGELGVSDLVEDLAAHGVAPVADKPEVELPPGLTEEAMEDEEFRAAASKLL